MNDNLFLGIDGGATKTHAVLVNAEGHPLSEGFGEGSNYHALGIDATRENVRIAVTKAWLRLGLDPQPSAAAFLGMAGVVSNADRSVILGIAMELRLAPPDHIGVDHDLRIALAGGLAGDEGVALIAGTGSSCYGRGDEGVAWRAGGWGHVLDDAGGGYWMGLQGMVAVTRALDMRGEPTNLTGLLPDALGIADMRQAPGLLHDGTDVKSKVSALAPLVLSAAEQGDPASQKIVDRGADELAVMVEAVMRALEWTRRDEVPVVMVGSLLGKSPTYRKAVESAIRRRAPNALPRDPLLSPALGAAKLATESIPQVSPDHKPPPPRVRR